MEFYLVLQLSLQDVCSPVRFWCSSYMIIRPLRTGTILRMLRWPVTIAWRWWHNAWGTGKSEYAPIKGIFKQPYFQTRMSVLEDKTLEWHCHWTQKKHVSCVCLIFLANKYSSICVINVFILALNHITTCMWKRSAHCFGFTVCNFTVLILYHCFCQHCVQLQQANVFSKKKL